MMLSQILLVILLILQSYAETAPISLNDGTLVYTPQEEKFVEKSIVQKCANGLCNVGKTAAKHCLNGACKVAELTGKAILKGLELTGEVMIKVLVWVIKSVIELGLFPIQVFFHAILHWLDRLDP